MSSNNGKIVRLNVGGTKYEVARSTIELYPDTMLARLVSDAWQKRKDGKNIKGETDEEIFIDSDGNRFGFILEYMRHQTVDLPMNVSKKAVLKELKYFGFKDVKEAAICCSGANWEALKHVTTMCTKEYNEKIQEMRRAIKEQEMLADFTEIAHHCFAGYLQNARAQGGVEVEVVSPYRERYFFYDKQMYHHSEKKLSPQALAVFNKCLAEYRLRYVSHGSTVLVTPLKTES